MRPGSHPPRSLPCIDLSFGHRPAEQSPGTADGRFQVGCIKRARGVGCRLQSRDDFPIEAAMMFLGTFFEVPVQVCWNVFQRDRRQLRNRNGSILVVHLARRGMRGKSRLFFRNAFHLPKVDRPSYFQTPVTLAKAQRNENEVAGTMPDESLTARISGGQAAVNLPTR